MQLDIHSKDLATSLCGTKPDKVWAYDLDPFTWYPRSIVEVGGRTYLIIQHERSERVVWKDIPANLCKAAIQEQRNALLYAQSLILGAPYTAMIMVDDLCLLPTPAIARKEGSTITQDGLIESKNGEGISVHGRIYRGPAPYLILERSLISPQSQPGREISLPQFTLVWEQGEGVFDPLFPHLKNGTYEL